MGEAEAEVRRERSARMEALVFAALFLGMVTVPRLLTPDSRGYGTHEQLFLPKCLFHQITTLPCPLCGITTSFAYLTRGQVVEAVRSHPAGPLLYLVAGLGGLYCLVRAVTGWNPLRDRLRFMLRPRYLMGAFAFLWVLALIGRFAWH